MIRVFLVLALSLIMIQCSSNDDISELSGYYRVNLPGEDCKFEVHSIELKEDGTFLYNNVHVGIDKTEQFAGTWEVIEGLVKLTSDRMDEEMILTPEDGMLRITKPVRLNGKGKVEPLMAKTKFLESNESTAQFLNGTDIYAEGFQARWFVAIGINKYIQLKHPVSGEIMTLPYSKPKVDYEKKTNIWRIDVGSETAIITLHREKCETDYPAHIEFEIGEETRESCSQYLNYQFSIHKIWELVEFNGKPMDGENLHRGLPVLEIDVVNRMGLGHTGCNVWNGGMKIRNDELIFMPGPMSNAYCEDKGFEVEYIKNLGQSLKYSLNNRRLTFYVDGQPYFVFHEFEG